MAVIHSSIQVRALTRAVVTASNAPALTSAGNLATVAGFVTRPVVGTMVFARPVAVSVLFKTHLAASKTLSTYGSLGC